MKKFIRIGFITIEGNSFYCRNCGSEIESGTDMWINKDDPYETYCDEACTPNG